MEVARKEKLEQRAVLVLLALFGVVLVSALKNMGMLGPKPHAAPQALEEGVSAVQQVHEVIQQAAAQAHGGAASTHSDETGSQKIAMPRVSYAADPRRDPMQPDFRLPAREAPVQTAPSSLARFPAESEPVRSALAPVRTSTSKLPLDKVQGAIWGAKPQVIIQGEVYQVGDVFERGRIVAIDRDGVTVEPSGAGRPGAGQPGSLPASAQATSGGRMEGR